jgi:L-ascorbate metabolism protein UlaG (beta-lactamase superfamily)
MRIKFLGQSGYIIKTDTTEIVIDPYLSDVVNKVASRPRLIKPCIEPETIGADAVICSHNHLDHLDTESVAKMPKETYFVTTNEGKEKLFELGQTNVSALNIGESLKIGDIEITAVFARHTVEAFGIIVKAENRVLYFSGDTLFDERLFEIGDFNPDITFICINGKLGNMNVEDALKVAKKIGAKVNIPNHYDMFASNSEDPHKFTDNISGGFIMKANTEYNLKDIIK